MKLLRTIFFLKRIYRTPTFHVTFYEFGVLGLILWIVVSGAYRPNLPFAPYRWIVLPVTMLYMYGLIRSLLRVFIVRHRISTAAFAGVNSMANGSHTGVFAPDLELDTIDGKSLLAEGDGWRMYDIVFNFYGYARYGRYLASRAFYTVYEARLIRQVPHVILDNRHAKGRQFRRHYHPSQKIQLEGDFDDHFDTYVPQTYHVDSLSFITPEVMHAFIEAGAYDIELSGDRLLMYGPLTDFSDLTDFKAAGDRVLSHLNDNLHHYRDDRLTGAARRTQVTPFGQALLENPNRHLPGVLLSLCAVGSVVYMGLFIETRMFFSTWTLISVGLFLTTTIRYYRVISYNRRAVRRIHPAHDRYE
jgi:hypothetical protein